jgi:hypothetical protein
MLVHQCNSLGAAVYHRQGTIGSVAALEQVCNINCGATSGYSLQQSEYASSSGSPTSNQIQCTFVLDANQRNNSVDARLEH